MAKKPEFYITRTEKLFGATQYLEDHFTNTFVPAYKKCKCPTFPKKRAEQIVARLKAHIPTGWENHLEIGMEAADVNWLFVSHIVDSIIHRRGFCPDAPNETIYAVLNVLGWEVVDENESEDC